MTKESAEKFLRKTEKCEKKSMTRDPELVFLSGQNERAERGNPEQEVLRRDHDKSYGSDTAPAVGPDAASSPPQSESQSRSCNLFDNFQPNCEPYCSRKTSSTIQESASEGRSNPFAGMMQAVVSQGVTTPGVGKSRDGGSEVARRNPLMVSSGLRRVSWRWQGQGVGGRLRAGVRQGGSSSKGLGVRCKVVSVNEGNFEAEVLKSDLPVLVDFWANWCGPCKLVATSMDVVDRKYEGKLKVVKVETDPNPKLVERYKVYGLPTLIMFREGEVISGGRYEGAISLAKLESMLKKVLPSLATA